MHTDRFRALVGAPGPFVSLYFGDSRDGVDPQEDTWARWGAVRRHLEDDAVADRVIGAIERAVLRGDSGTGRRGRAVIAGAEGVLIDEELGSPPAVTLLRVSEYPYLLPLFGDTAWHGPYVFASVDHLGAELTIHRGDDVRAEIVHGPAPLVHKPVTAGRNGYGDLTHKCDEAVRRNVRVIADKITDAVDSCSAEVLFLSGEVRSRTDVVSALPQRIVERIVQLPGGARGERTDEQAVSVLIDEEFTRRARDTDAQTLARFAAEDARGSGLAVNGVAETCAALRAGAVDTLIVGAVANTTVVCGQDLTTVAPDADSLSDLGEAPCRIALADEALPFAAVSTGASVVRADDVAELTDGIAALLRYAPMGAPKTRSQQLTSRNT
jgi:Bacterial archaeo-eukaryotic release factor family 2